MSESDILDEIIAKLRGQAGIDFNEQMKITDRLLKALAMKARLNAKTNKRKVFDLRSPVTEGREQ